MAKSKLSASERTSLTNQLNSYSGKKDKAVTAKNNLEADRTQLKGYIDSFEAESDANNLKKYLQSKFVRFLILQASSSIMITKKSQ